MSRPKRPVPTPPHVGAVDKMRRRAQLGDRPKRATAAENADFVQAWEGKPDKPKPRVVLGTPAALALGIKVQP